MRGAADGCVAFAWVADRPVPLAVAAAGARGVAVEPACCASSADGPQARANAQAKPIARLCGLVVDRADRAALVRASRARTDELGEDDSCMSRACHEHGTPRPQGEPARSAKGAPKPLA